MAKVEREKYSSKVVDEIAMRAGHTVIQLPPYHCELNPIELAWAVDKNFVAKKYLNNFQEHLFGILRLRKYQTSLQSFFFM